MFNSDSDSDSSQSGSGVSRPRRAWSADEEDETFPRRRTRSEMSEAPALAPTAPRASGSSRPLSWVARQYNLNLSASLMSDRLTLTGANTTVTIVPGLEDITVNGRPYRLSEAPAFSSGELMLPPDLFPLLPKAEAEEAGIPGAKVIILDPGHGGKDPGTQGAGLQEKSITLKIALYAREILRTKGYNVKMTRTSDVYPTLEERCDLANRTPNSLFISIHVNANNNRSTSGIETYVLSDEITDSWRVTKATNEYGGKGSINPAMASNASIRAASSRARSASLNLANSIHGRVVRASGDDSNGVRKANYHVLRETYFSPAVLVETGYLSHAATARKFQSDAYLRSLATAIADGIMAAVKPGGSGVPAAASSGGYQGGGRITLVPE